MDRFWSKVDIKGPDDCWLWLAWRDKRKSGKECYGRFRYKGIMDRAHRVAYELVIGGIPKGLYILHKCDTPACVNPAHLFVGTQKDNMQDMAAKDRRPSQAGAKHPNARLTEEEVLEIRELGQQGLPPRKLAPLYGVSNNYIYEIIIRKAWAHV